MHLRNIFLVMKREYLERVKSRAFMISTILVPVFMFLVTAGPSLLASRKASGSRNLTVVTSNPEFAKALASRLNNDSDHKVNVATDLNVTDTEREALRAKLTAQEIDGYIWAPDNAIADRKITYVGRSTSDFVEMASLRGAVTMAAMQLELAKRGVAPGEMQTMLKPFSVETVRIENGKETKRNTAGAFIVAYGMGIFLYMIMIMYGAMVMQSVLEEKSTRIVEVLLASVSSDDLMIGKIVGVGAAGLTQVLIWAGAGLFLSAQALAAIKSMGISLDIPVGAMIAFPVFYLLGFLLYSACFAAVGAAVNSLQEAQQFNFIVMSPMIFSIVMMMFVIRQPDAPLSVTMSLIPFTAPIIMYLRIAVQQPPAGQIATSVGLLAGAVFVMMWLCARIYRVGILMYGKKPNLPELIKWLRYA
jgi:ABC-2 type transport system permease protein